MACLRFWGRTHLRKEGVSNGERKRRSQPAVGFRIAVTAWTREPRPAQGSRRSGEEGRRGPSTARTTDPTEGRPKRRAGQRTPGNGNSPKINYITFSLHGDSGMLSPLKFVRGTKALLHFFGANPIVNFRQSWSGSLLRCTSSTCFRKARLSEGCALSGKGWLQAEHRFISPCLTRCGGSTRRSIDTSMRSGRFRSSEQPRVRRLKRERERDRDPARSSGVPAREDIPGFAIMILSPCPYGPTRRNHPTAEDLRTRSASGAARVGTRCLEQSDR